MMNPSCVAYFSMRLIFSHHYWLLVIQAIYSIKAFDKYTESWFEERTCSDVGRNKPRLHS
jgi:hypothetical protein